MKIWKVGLALIFIIPLFLLSPSTTPFKNSWLPMTISTPHVANAQTTCISCHNSSTPGIVEQWEDSKHYEAEVTCNVCHEAQGDDPSGYDHNGYVITAVPSPKTCARCHPDQTEEFWDSKHAWAAFMGPLKPYYEEAIKQGLDPLSQETAKSLNPEEMAEHDISYLFPESSALERAGLLNDPSYNHTNVFLGCMQCHGSFIIAEEDNNLSGWPNAGIGRINPDGTLGSCSSCHTRHLFSMTIARKPETCGRCHMGPDHPQIEIYTESKHGNIYGAEGESWNWTAPTGQWGPDDITAPTCATCHMSGFGGAVETTHDVGERLYWELQPRKSVPQWKGPDEVDIVLERVSDLEKAETGRREMKKVCRQCHSDQWINNYFIEFDGVVNDYNMVYEYTDELLKQAYEEDLISDDLPLDEIPEVMHYYIWHHAGRRWRMGASMMGPDWTHWNGAVEAVLDNLNVMEDWIAHERTIKELQVQIQDGQGALGTDDLGTFASIGTLLLVVIVLAVIILLLVIIVLAVTYMKKLMAYEDKEKRSSLDKVSQGRRTFIKSLFIFSFVALFGSISSLGKVIFPSTEDDTNGNGPPNGSDENFFKYRRVEGTWFYEKAGQMVNMMDFEVGKGASVLWRENIYAVLLKLDPDKLGFNEGTEQGFVAFYAKCTHMCCIGNYRIDNPDLDKIFCSCHNGVFDPYQQVEDSYNDIVYYGAKVTEGPPQRALPQIPVKIEDGKVLGEPTHLEWYNYCK